LFVFGKGFRFLKLAEWISEVNSGVRRARQARAGRVGRAMFCMLVASGSHVCSSQAVSKSWTGKKEKTHPT
jgi:hypothetical protein